jgi:hypothetical protein
MHTPWHRIEGSYEHRERDPGELPLVDLWFAILPFLMVTMFTCNCLHRLRKPLSIAVESIGGKDEIVAIGASRAGWQIGAVGEN